MPTGGGGGSSSPKGWPLTAALCGFTQNALSNTTANAISGAGFILPYSLTFAHITVQVSTSDAVNNYDAGIYSLAGTLIANIGAQHIPSTGYQTFASVQGSLTINPGLYVLAITGNSATGAFGYNSTQWGWIAISNVGTSAGGALPASITGPTISPAANLWFFNLT